MTHRLFILGTLLLAAVLLVGGLTACQREAPGREAETAGVENQTPTAEFGAGLETPIPGQTVISAVTTPDQGGTPSIGAQATPELQSPTATFAIGASTSAAETPIPPGEGYVVYAIQAGDTLSDLATKYGTTVEAIAQANGITDPSTISPGQQIKIPTPSGSTVQPTAQPATGACGKWVNSGGCRYLYTVKPGDWIYQIARACGVDPNDIVSANRSKLPNPSVVQPGLVLCIP